MDRIFTGGTVDEQTARTRIMGCVVTAVQYDIDRREGLERMVLVCFTRDGELEGGFCLEGKVEGDGHLTHIWIEPDQLRELDPSLAERPSIF